MLAGPHYEACQTNLGYVCSFNTCQCTPSTFVTEQIGLCLSQQGCLPHQCRSFQRCALKTMIDCYHRTWSRSKNEG